MSEPFTLTGHNPADGQLPEGWEISPIGDRCKIISGSTPKTSVPEYWGGDIPWLTPDDLSKNRSKIVERGARSITPAGLDSCSTRLVPQGSVIFTSRAPIGYVAIAANEMCTNQGFKTAVPGSDIRSDFLYWQLQHVTPDIRSRASGTTFLEISGKGFAATKIVVPPLAEQEQIVEILEEQLSRLDAALESVRVVREKAAQFRRSLLHAAFTGTLTGHNPADGQLPEGWESVPIGTLSPNGDFFDGDWVESKDQDPTGAVRLTQLADIGEGNFRNRSDRWLRDDQAEHLNVNFLQEGDLLIARMPDPLGRCCALPKLEHHSVTVVDVAVLRIRSQSILNTFVMWILNSPIVRRRMVELASGTTRQRISRKNLSTIELPIPPLAEQERIVEILEEQLSRLDAALALADAIEKRSAALRRSLLHAAFTGRLTEQWRESVHV